MGVATAPPPSLTHSKNHNNSELASGSETCVNSMSQGFHQGIFSFSNGFDRSTISPHHHHHQPPHIAQQSRRDKLRVQGFDPPPPPLPLVGIEEEVSGELPGYETAGMLSEMFNFPSGTATAADLLENQIASSYRLSRPSPVTNEWYGNRQVGGLGPLGDGKHHHHHHHHQPNSNDRHSNSSSSSIVPQQIPGINADSAAAMHLFLMNPQPRSPSPPHPNPSNTSNPHHVQGFQSAGVAAAAASAFGDNPIHHSQFTWVPGGSAGGDNNSNKIGGVVESQGLSLSLSSLQHLETAKAEELRIGDGGVMYYGLGNGGSTAAAAASYPSMKNLRNHNPPPHHQHPQDIHVGFGSSSLGVVNVLRISKYSKPARELLEEFCSVGRGQFKMKKHSSTSNPNPNQGNGTGTGGAGGSSPSSSKDISPLSSSDRIEYQRRKVKLLSMIDEVDRRYNHYCEQMQMVVNSFDSVMGFGAATPYTALAQKAMSRHFRCLKDAIAAQLKQTCELLGEKDGATASGVTKGETPRLRMLEESLRQQRAFHQMGIMEQEAWRPQRGLPERSVNILRAWLFEHFLHPYPSDTDKHLLARQTGLSRNQVSNWFINARVRLWKPMVEEMYQKEAKEEAEERDGDEREISPLGQSSSSAQTPTPTTATAASATTPVVVPVPPPPTAATTTSSSKTISTTAQGKRSEINAHDNDPSLNAINRQCFGTTTTTTTTFTGDVLQRFPATHVLDDTCRQNGHSGILAAADYGTTAVGTNMGPTLLRFGTTTTTTTTGDVSLTLGLRHAGNLPEQSPFAVRDFGGC
ncbi:BEL1-like homeodomain protein 4 [Macadamia integrifolia]|uniref:BEL1-like homeodomain protein 4 n=1 Tax=Macadamia integrifolia TaxID=60698 RepID=UPI001C4FD0E8|nr:BEL1-like homeodomain protein 4 [Macadamia integrifolia]